MSIALCLLGSYLAGSIPTGYIVFRLAEKKDIRRFGSLSTGATNVFRTKGLAYALPVILVDVAKGFLPPFLARHFFADIRVTVLAALLAVLGHCYPVFIRFKGGKGVATVMGAYAFFAFLPFLLSLAVFVIAIALSRFVSLGSLAAAFLYPFFALALKADPGVLIFGLLAFLLILWRHQENIGRLASGTERRLGQKAEVEKK